METRIQSDLIMKRKVCELCGEGIFEFDPETQGRQKYICTSCSAS